MNYTKNPDLLWKVFLGYDQRGYLLGSMHVDTVKTRQVVRSVSGLIDGHDRMLLEFNPQESLQEDIDHLLRYSGTESVSSLLPPAKYQRIRKRILHFAEIDIASFDRVPPLFLISQIYNSFLPKHSGPPMDLQLFLMAQEKGIEVAGLESFEGQVELLKSIPLKIQTKALEDLSRRYSHHKKLVSKSINQYGNLPIQQLYKLNKKQMGPLRRELIYDRNFRMTDAIDTQLQEARCFVVVGVGHLAGKFGLIRLLKKCGYRLNVAKHIK